MKRDIEKVLRMFFKKYQYDVTVEKRGESWWVEFEPSMRLSDDWEIELGEWNYAVQTRKDIQPNLFLVSYPLVYC